MCFIEFAVFFGLGGFWWCKSNYPEIWHEACQQLLSQELGILKVPQGFQWTWPLLDFDYHIFSQFFPIGIVGSQHQLHEWNAWPSRQHALVLECWQNSAWLGCGMWQCWVNWIPWCMSLEAIVAWVISWTYCIMDLPLSFTGVMMLGFSLCFNFYAKELECLFQISHGVWSNARLSSCVGTTGHPGIMTFHSEGQPFQRGCVEIVHI